MAFALGLSLALSLWSSSFSLAMGFTLCFTLSLALTLGINFGFWISISLWCETRLFWSCFSFYQEFKLLPSCAPSPSPSPLRRPCFPHQSPPHPKNNFDYYIFLCHFCNRFFLLYVSVFLLMFRLLFLPTKVLLIEIRIYCIFRKSQFCNSHLEPLASLPGVAVVNVFVAGVSRSQLRHLLQMTKNRNIFFYFRLIQKHLSNRAPRTKRTIHLRSPPHRTQIRPRS